MNMLEAMRDTVALLESKLPTMGPHYAERLERFSPDLRPPHIRGMLKIMESGVNPQDTERSFSEGKMGRWLGWAQAAVVAINLATLDDMKAINRKHADQPTRVEVPNDLGGRIPGHDADGNYSTAQMMRDEMGGGDTSQPLFD